MNNLELELKVLKRLSLTGIAILYIFTSEHRNMMQNYEKLKSEYEYSQVVSIYLSYV